MINFAIEKICKKQSTPHLVGNGPSQICDCLWKEVLCKRRENPLRRERVTITRAESPFKTGKNLNPL
jgi:hypothetical protein